MSTQAMTQQRCASEMVSATVTFTESMTITMKKDNFLLNPTELSVRLQNVGSATHHANGDADLLIVKAAVESTRMNTSVLVGDHASEYDCDLYFRPEPKANARGAFLAHGESQRTAG